VNILVISQDYYPENFKINDITQELVQVAYKVTVLCVYLIYFEDVIQEKSITKSRE